MFKFVFKKGLYNLVITAYESHFYIYQKGINSIIPSLTNTTSEEEMQHLDNIATQKYYSAVFDYVCQEVSNNVPRFKMLLPLNLQLIILTQTHLSLGTFMALFFGAYIVKNPILKIIVPYTTLCTS